MAVDKKIFASSATSWREKLGAMISGGSNTGDTMRNIYLDYGWPETIEFVNFWNMYRRFGIAKNIVELPVDTGWSTIPTIEGSEKLVSGIEALDKRFNFWLRLKGLDTRQRVGRYAGMFMRVRDGKKPSEPLEGKLSGESVLLEMMPLYESQLKVTETDQDPNSDNFGQPVMIEYNQGADGSRNEDANNSINIHASRIVFAAEGADNGWIQGIPALEASYNSLMDLQKIIGGSAEGFYKNAAQSVIFNLQDAASAATYKDKLDDFSENYDDFTKNRFRRGMWTPGMDVNTLESRMMSPKDSFEVSLSDAAAGAQIPATILIGKQTGRLASEEDSTHFLSTVQSRRGNFMTEMIRANIDWCMEWGILPFAEYDVIWDNLLARSDEERLKNGDNMAAINQKQFQSGGDEVFSAGEIREMAGYEPEELPEAEDGESMQDDDE